MTDILNEEVRWIDGCPYIVPRVVYPPMGDEADDEQERGAYTSSYTADTVVEEGQYNNRATGVTTNNYSSYSDEPDCRKGKCA